MIASTRLAVAWLTMFVVGTELFVFSPLLPVLAAAYHVAPALAGLSVTMFSLAYMLSAPLLGCFSDRIGRRQVLIYSLLAFALANILTAAAANLWSLLVVRLFAGVAAAGISPSIYALVGDAAPADRRATWMALAVSGLVVSLAIGASTGGLVGALFGGPPVFLALAGFSLMLVWLNQWVWPSEHDGAATGLQAAPDALSAAVLTRRLIPMVMWSTGLYAVYTYLGAGLAAVGFSSGQTATAIAIYGCGAIVGILVGGHVADRLGVKYTASASLTGLCTCLLLRLAIDEGRFVEPALGLSSAVAQLFFPAQQAGLAKDFPRHRAAVLAWNSSALFFGISLGSLIGAAVVASSFATTLTVSAGIALSGCILNAILVPGGVQFGAKQKCSR
jgi:predicted MFS family arabinose efflux permease